MGGFIEREPPAGLRQRDDAAAAASWLVEAVADALALRLDAHLERAEDVEDRWMNSAEAADYLGITRNALHKLSSAREIPFEQEGPGCKLYFRRTDLDAWRRGERGVHE